LKSTHLFFLFLFHALISWFTYHYLVGSPSDAHLYWLVNYDVHLHEWSYFFRVGTGFVIFLNYPFLKLGFPFWLGHLIYSLIGFFGVIIFAKWSYKVLALKNDSFFVLVLLGLVLLSPNLHIWTSIIGKESIVFLSISTLFYTSLNIKKYWVYGALASFMLIMIRPHVAFMLLVALFIGLGFNKQIHKKVRISLGLILPVIGVFLFYIMLQISRIRYFDWDRILEANAYSLLSKSDLAGYIPMNEYDIFTRIFALNFRPLFFDAHNSLSFFASLENIFSLLFIIMGLFLFIKNFRKIKIKPWVIVCLSFFLIASLFYIQRYSNLGLFMRTKMMYMPFLYIAVISFFKQSINHKTQIKLLRLTTVPLSLQYLLKGQLGFMRNYFEVKAISSGPLDALELVKHKEGVEVQEVAMSRQITPIKDLLALFKLIRVFRKEKPTIVHTHTPKAGILGMLAANLAGVPIRLHTVAGMPLMEAKGGKRKVLDAVEKLTYACATKVYPNSKGLQRFILENNYAKKEKVKVIANGSSNGIDTSHFNPENYTQQQNQDLRKQLGIQKADFVFIFVGRLVGDKGINELIKVFKSLSFGEGFRVRLLLVGPQESELDPLLPETLQEIESNQNIIAVGFQEDVRAFFAISDALAFPSYREGFPNVVMQAGAMGLPSIVSDINGCNEIIVEGKNGLIIPVKNTEALQKAMQRLVEDSYLYEQLKSQSREMITSRYEQKVVWEALLEEYRRLLRDIPS